MELVRIFGPEHHEWKGLFAVRYQADDPDEIERLFDCWNDNAYLEKFAADNSADLPGIPDEHQVTQFVHTVRCEAQELEELLYESDPEETDSPVTLQVQFRPLVNSDERLYVLQLSKTSAKTRKRPQPVLRIYGIRIAEDTYVVTGGAIKLTQFMKDRDHTDTELKKITKVRDWLKNAGVTEAEDLGNLEHEP